MLGQKFETSPLKYCPLIKKKCISNKCMFWVSFTNELKTTTETCAVIMGVMLHSQVVVEQIRTQATLDKATNVIALSMDNLLSLAETASKRALKSPN